MNFYISNSIEKRGEPYWFERTDYVDISELLLTILDFGSKYKCLFFLNFDNCKLPFHYRGDLSIVIEELPEIFNNLIDKEYNNQVIEFAEQSTELNMLLNRDGRLLKVKMVKTGEKLYMREALEDGQEFIV